MRPLAYRQHRILERLQEESFASVAGLAAELRCSQMTIRRDLARLQSQGLVERSRGGAVPSRKIRLEFALAERAQARQREKAAIARAAAALVRPGDRVLIDTGTTTLALVRELRSRENISVVTTSLAVVSALLPSPGIECMLLGGIVRESSPDLYGPLLEDNLSRIHPDWAFIGCDGISLRAGLTTADARVARATALMVANASRVALLCDSSKATNDSFMTFAQIADIDVLITDDAMSVEVLDAARAVDVETIVVTAIDEKRASERAESPEAKGD